MLIHSKLLILNFSKRKKIEKFSDLCRNQSFIMKNNYSRKNTNQKPDGGKRVGKSLPIKTSAGNKRKGADAKVADQPIRYSKPGIKKTYSKSKPRISQNIPRKIGN